MAKVSISTIKNWFRTLLKPTQAQFWDTWDSFWHKDETLPISSVENLTSILNSKADNEQVKQYTDNKINSLTSIRSIVKTYSDLEALNRNDLRIGDEYIVEADEQKEGITSVYKCCEIDEHNADWVWLGKIGSAGSQNIGNSNLTLTDNERILALKHGSLSFQRTTENEPQSKIKISNSTGIDCQLTYETSTALNCQWATDYDDSQFIVHAGSVIRQYYAEDRSATVTLSNGGYGILTVSGSASGKSTNFVVDYNNISGSVSDTIYIDGKEVDSGCMFHINGSNFYFKLPTYTQEESGKYVKLTDRFPYVNSNGEIIFLTADEFKQKLNI